MKLLSDLTNSVSVHSLNLGITVDDAASKFAAFFQKDDKNNNTKTNTSNNNNMNNTSPSSSQIASSFVVVNESASSSNYSQAATLPIINNNNPNQYGVVSRGESSPIATRNQVPFILESTDEFGSNQMDLSFIVISIITTGPCSPWVLLRNH